METAVYGTPVSIQRTEHFFLFKKNVGHLSVCRDEADVSENILLSRGISSPSPCRSLHSIHSLRLL